MANDAHGGTQAIPYYVKSVDWDRFIADWPPPPHFHDTTGRLSDDAMRALQERRFLARVAEAWSVPFYRDRWRAAGLEPGARRPTVRTGPAGRDALDVGRGGAGLRGAAMPDTAPLPCRDGGGGGCV